jgi:hypothetical protein
VTVHQLFIDFKEAYDSVRREILYNILIEFGIPMKLVRLIKMCLNETYSKVRIGKHFVFAPHVATSLTNVLYTYILAALDIILLSSVLRFAK